MDVLAAFVEAVLISVVFMVIMSVIVVGAVVPRVVLVNISVVAICIPVAAAGVVDEKTVCEVADEVSTVKVFLSTMVME